MCGLYPNWDPLESHMVQYLLAPDVTFHDREVWWVVSGLHGGRRAPRVGGWWCLPWRGGEQLT